MHTLSLRELLSLAYAYIIRNIDTRDAREQIDGMLGLTREEQKAPEEDVVASAFGDKQSDERPSVTPQAADALTAFMADLKAQEPDLRTPTIEDVSDLTIGMS